MAPHKLTWEERIAMFRSKVDSSNGPNSCWPYLGWTSRMGYGQFWAGDGKRFQAHAFAYLLAFGPHPTGKPYTCHHCDNPPCCNPAHLFAGNHLDNMMDRDQKGRQAKGDRSGDHLHPEAKPRGDNHWTHRHPEWIPRGEYRCRPGARLTLEDVRAIRDAAGTGESQRSIARRFGITQTNVSQIYRRRIWSWVS